LNARVKCVLSVAHTRSLHGVFRPTEDHPASQYFDSVQRGSVAENSGLKTGDFLLEVGHIFTIPRVFTLFEDVHIQSIKDNYVYL